MRSNSGAVRRGFCGAGGAASSPATVPPHGSAARTTRVATVGRQETPEAVRATSA